MRKATKKERKELQTKWIKENESWLSLEWCKLDHSFIVDYFLNKTCVSILDTKKKLRDSFIEYCVAVYEDNEAQYLIKNGLCIF